MSKQKATFAPGKSELFWCDDCNLPLISGECSTCKRPGRPIELAPPGDVRLCSRRGRELLIELFEESFGFSDFLRDGIILLNKIAGLDRRDQVILDNRHIATLWFDVAVGRHRLDLEASCSSLLAAHARRGLVVCDESILKGHIKGKWLSEDAILSRPAEILEGDNLVLKIGRLSGVGIVRKKGTGEPSIRIKDVTKAEFKRGEKRPGLPELLSANEMALKELERVALKEIKSYTSKSRLPVNVSFSGGKDSLACLCLAQKALFRPDVIFINTGLEYPETVQYVRDLSRSLKLRLFEIMGEEGFFERVRTFGPPAKDYRWCCKTNKLGPMTTFLKEHYPKGCVTIDGRRIYESFNRASIGLVERNPYVPGQTTLAPIRSWRALEVMLYIHWNGIEPNPLYEEDLERIGCWLCPAALQSEFSGLLETHPDLHEEWSSFLLNYAKEKGLDRRYADWGLWRWKRHPPKILELAREHHLDLRARAADADGGEVGVADGGRDGAKDGGGKGGWNVDGVSLEAVRGRSPCGLEHSIEARLGAPLNHPFEFVAGGLAALGEVKHSQELGAAILTNRKGRATVFAGGHIMIIAGKRESEEMLLDVCHSMLRIQMCTGCRICEKSCPRGAISVDGCMRIDGSKCNHCGRCFSGCISTERARRICSEIIRE